MDKLRKLVIYNDQAEYVIYFEVNKYNFINKGQITFLDNQKSSIISSLKEDLSKTKLVGIHIEYLKRLLSKNDEDFVCMLYQSNSNFRESVIKTLYNGFEFLGKETFVEVVNYETEPSRYIHRKIKQT